MVSVEAGEAGEDAGAQVGDDEPRPAEDHLHLRPEDHQEHAVEEDVQEAPVEEEIGDQAPPLAVRYLQVPQRAEPEEQREGRHRARAELGALPQGQEDQERGE